LDHSDEPLLEYVSSNKGTTAQSVGPIPEFLAKKEAEQATKTYRQYRESLGQLVTFLNGLGRTNVGGLTIHTVNLFRTHLRQSGMAENTVINRLRAIRAFSRWLGERGSSPTVVTSWPSPRR
jgi:site-specific recombinase XerC